MAIDRDNILHVASKYVEKDKYDKAILEYQKLIGVDGSDARTLLKIGDLQSRLKRYEDAIASYNRVATIYADGGFSLKAIAVFKQVRELLNKHAPELKKNYAHIMPRLADIYAQLNLISDALAAYDEAATAHQKAGRDLEAIKIFQKTVHLDPKNPLPYLRLAEASCRVKQVDDAVSAFWTASELLLSLERPDDALKVIERILHFREEPLYARAAGKLYLKRNDQASGLQALAKLQLAFAADPKDLETLGLLAQAFELILQPEKALAVHIEMARIAHEQYNYTLFNDILAHLEQTAPQHQQVLALRQLALKSNIKSAAPSTQTAAEPSPVVNLDDEVEYSEEPVDLNDELEEEAEETDFTQALDRTIAPAYERPHTDSAQATSERSRESFQPQAHVYGAISQAEALRAEGALDQAVLKLHAALEVDANSIPVRQKLREILVEGGDREGAIAETMNIAIIHVHNQNPDAAELLAQEILEIEPDDADALNILAHVGALRDNQNIIGAEEHLNSYDLEGIHPSHLINEIPEPPAANHVPTQGQAQVSPGWKNQAAAEAQEVEAESLEEEEYALDEDEIEDVSPQPPFGNSPAKTSLTAQAPEGFQVHRPSLEAIEEALEEAEFFTTQGLYEDAIGLLSDMLNRAPDHILLAERLSEVRNEALSDRRANEPLAETTAERAQDSSLEDQVLDIAASLDALDHLTQPEAADVLNKDAEVDVDLVLAQFKEGVKKTVKDSDAATHYDLGLAYKEMGLLADAQAEFELAGQDKSRSFMCFAMIGMIAAERQDDKGAIRAFLQALASTEKAVPKLVSLRYDLALAYERCAESKKAIEQYQTILKLDASYRDVAARLSALGGENQRTAAEDEDALDAAFDHLLS